MTDPRRQALLDLRGRLYMYSNIMASEVTLAQGRDDLAISHYLLQSRFNVLSAIQQIELELRDLPDEAPSGAFSSQSQAGELAPGLAEGDPL